MHICFLDIDGTLVLTGGAGQTAFAQTLAEDFGIAQLVGSVAFAGRSDRAIAMELFRLHGVEPSAENWTKFYTGYLNRLDAALAAHQGYVLPGVNELLAELTHRGNVALGLLTGNVKEGARRKLSHYKLWHWFAFGGYGDDYLQRCDIAAAALADAQAHLSRQPRGDGCNGDAAIGEILVIGDTVHDIGCGRSIGARCVAVATGKTTPAELRQSDPDVVVETLLDLRPILRLLD
jgi:phosphoglycolate phosphatase-like HAD superfamily hydrolase